MCQAGSLSSAPQHRTHFNGFVVRRMHLDLCFHYLRSLGGRLSFFRNGWGEFKHHRWLEAVRGRSLPPPQPLQLYAFRKHAIGYEASFASPAAEFLPPESATGRVWIVEPPRNIFSPKPEPPQVVVHLAATGDHGPYLRYALFARRLAKHGVTSVILENPFYGGRRPAHQPGAKLTTVAELADLGRATVEEACGLLAHWVHSEGSNKLCLSGISQGGLHAAMAVSLCPFPVHCVMSLAPASAAPVFTRDCLSTAVDWHALENSTPPSIIRRGGSARADLERVLNMSATIMNFPEQISPRSRHILFAADADCYVGRDSVQTWSEARPQLELRWLPGGHISAVALHSSQIQKAIMDVLCVIHAPISTSHKNSTWRFWRRLI